MSATPRPVQIVPSVLPADFANLGRDCQALEEAGVDRIQWDVMDGVFVPNLTFGPDVIAACRDLVAVPFEAHLMAERPEDMIGRYVEEAGCEMLIFHPETLAMPHRTYQQVREMGARVGIALSPHTPLDHLEHVLDLVDQIVIMTVNPGFGGQSYIATMEPKVRAAAAMVAESGFDIDIEVDGGIGPSTIAGAAAAGANVFISGSALWQYDSFTEGVADLRSRAEAAR